MTLSTADLMKEGFTTDMICGWEAQLALKSTTLKAYWPEHFKGRRVEQFERGAFIARMWLSSRRGLGVARRKVRGEELKETGAITITAYNTCLDRLGEQRRALADIMETQRRVDAKLAAEQAAGDIVLTDGTPAL